MTNELKIYQTRYMRQGIKTQIYNIIMVAKQDKTIASVSWIFKGERYLSLSLFYEGSKETELKIEGDP